MFGDYFYKKGYDEDNQLNIVARYLNDQLGIPNSKVSLYKTHIDKNGIFHILKNKVIIFSVEYFYDELFYKKVINFIESEILAHKLKILGDD